MLDKYLAWGGNALLGCALVLLASQQAAFAQEVAPEEVAEPTASGTVRIPLSGLATIKRVEGLSIVPDRIDSGLIEIGDSKSVTLVLEHTGASDDAPIAIGSATLFGKSANEYNTDFTGNVTLYPGDTQSVSVTFTPQVTGPKSAGLALDVDGASTPVAILFDGDSRYPFVAEIKSSTTDLGFGQIVEGGTIAKTISLENDGDPQAPPLFISAVQLEGDFVANFEVDFQPVSLQPGDTYDMVVKLTGQIEGNKTAVLSVFHDGNNETVEIELQGEIVKPAAVPVGFATSDIGLALQKPTSLALGPDGKLYVSEQNGLIHVFQTNRNGKNNYSAQKLETIDLVNKVLNHDDQGNAEPNKKGRQVTGLLLEGTAAAPVIWVASSDPEIGGGSSGADKNLDTNSGILHKLTKNGGGWQKQDVVRGLPRSEENHGSNGMVMKGGKIILMQGGHTNMGVPSNNFAETPEYALSAAALEIDVASIGNGTYDLPTLDDPASDGNDPFGGNDGKNQAKLVQGGPVQIWSTGLRNAYDVVLTEAGKLYTYDNGPNSGWGGEPNGDCGNGIKNGGVTHNDQLHLMTKGSHGGHPNPVRGNKSNTFGGQTPVEIAANPVECQHKLPGNDDSMTDNKGSTNGITEYTATNFAGAMYGDLLAISYGGKLYRLQLNAAGNGVTSKNVLEAFNGGPQLDVIAHGDADPYPGTIWVIDYIANKVFVLEPDDY